MRSTAPSPNRSCARSPIRRSLSCCKSCTRCGSRYELFSDENPMMAMLKPMASWVREHRSAAPPTTHLSAGRRTYRNRSLRRWTLGATRATILWNRCSSPLTVRPRCRQLSGSIRQACNAFADLLEDPWHQELLRTRIAELKAGMSVGGLRAAAVRALLYVGNTGARSTSAVLQLCVGCAANRTSRRARLWENSRR